MDTEKILTHGQQVKVATWKYSPKATVGTLQGSARKDAKNWKEPEEKLVQEALARECLRSAKCGERPRLAWVSQPGTMISCDYPGKAEEHRREAEAYENATELKERDVVRIEGLRYFVRILDKDGYNYSNPIHFEVIPEYPDYN